MKQRFQFASLRPVGDARVPAALSLVLVGGLAAQLLVPDEVALPAFVPGQGARAAANIGAPPPVIVASVVMARVLFAPGRAAASGASVSAGAAPPDPLGGASVAGVVRVGTRGYAVVQYGGGRTARVPVGGSVAGWRLAAIGADGVTLRRGAARMLVPFGARGGSVPQSEPEPQAGGESE